MLKGGSQNRRLGQAVVNDAHDIGMYKRRVVISDEAHPESYTAKTKQLFTPLELGVIAEEVQIVTPYHRLLFSCWNLPMARQRGRRNSAFVFTGHRDRFQRMPWIIDAKDLAKLRAELARPRSCSGLSCDSPADRHPSACWT
jgi:hypothetical protein